MADEDPVLSIELPRTSLARLFSRKLKDPRLPITYSMLEISVCSMVPSLVSRLRNAVSLDTVTSLMYVFGSPS